MHSDFAPVPGVLLAISTEAQRLDGNKCVCVGVCVYVCVGVCVLVCVCVFMCVSMLSFLPRPAKREKVVGGGGGRGAGKKCEFFALLKEQASKYLPEKFAKSEKCKTCLPQTLKYVAEFK